MALNFLNNINLNKNQLQQAAIENLGTDPASGVLGQIIFNTTDGSLKVCTVAGSPTGAVYSEVGGGVVTVTSGNSNTITIGGTLENPTVAANTAAVTNGSLNLATGDQIYDFVTTLGYVETVGIANSTFVSLADSGTAVDPILTASLSATGSPSATTFLRGDNTWATPADDNTTSLPVKNNGGTTQFTSTDTTGIRFAGTGSTTVSFTAGTQLVTIDSGNETITLSGDVTGSGTTAITTTISAGAVDFAMLNSAAVVTQAEGIAANDNDTTLPTSAAVKDYVDSSIVGQLVYQGGYDAATNTPNLDATPVITINTGFTWTVTADGTFFTEQVRVGDVLIANNNAPTTLAEWTTVQNNIDLATTTTVGIASFSADNFAVSAGGQVTIKDNGVILGTETTGNYVATIGEGAGIDVTGSGSETAAVTVTLNLNELTVATGPTHLAGNDGSGNTRKFTITEVADEVSAANSFAATISASATVTHSLGTNDVVIQLYDTVTLETVYADMDRSSVNAVDITFATVPTNSIRVLVQKIG